jgi:RimJ/RimL family protein N-acetyltransferase
VRSKFHSEAWSAQNSEDALAYLKANYATSMFLLGNLAERAPGLGEHPNSGNFKVLKKDDAVIGVFSLLRRGNLIISADFDDEILDLVLRDALTESISIKGVLGNWGVASALWDLLQERKILQTCSFRSKEILYRLDSIPRSDPNPQVRFLNDTDYPEWRPIRRAYTKEEGLTDNLSDEDLKKNFLLYSGRKEYWGYFEDERLVSTAALNAKAMNIGQVGGVYTVPALRGKGYSQRTMQQMLNDCAQVHGLVKMILFTGEKNIPAQRVYEKLGFQKIGLFGIFFI